MFPMACWRAVNMQGNVETDAVREYRSKLDDDRHCVNQDVSGVPTLTTTSSRKPKQITQK
jgi:hypothetical protein